MSGKIKVILGYHEHLPSEGTEQEFEERYNTVLKPIVTFLNDSPDIPAMLHFSGPLLERIERKKPEFFLLLSDLVARKQVELLGGGFYEPLFPLLPLADRIGQVETFTTYIRKNFGKKPRGCCLAFGAWEQSLAGVLNSCGMSYTFLSAEQFISAGITGPGLCSPVIAEDQGKTIIIFPVFSSFEDIKAFSDRTECHVATIFPRFPRNALAFFENLRKGVDEKRLEPILPGRALKLAGPLKRAYFPPSVAFAGDNYPFSHPKYFLMRCAEANSLYSKMFFVHTLINQLKGDKSRKRMAREELWKAQGADVFHADAFRVDGERDIVCADVRKNAYKALISAERITREKRNFTPALSVFDLDFDGQAEYLFQDKNINCYIMTGGASVFELDYLPKNWNYLDTFSSEGFRRCAFMDRLLEADVSFERLEALAAARGAAASADSGRSCADELYEVSSDKQRNRAVFRLPPKKDAPFGGIEIEKSYQLEKNVLELSYTLTNRGNPLSFSFSFQSDFSFAGSKQHAVYAPDSVSGDTEPHNLLGGAREIRTFEAADTKNNTVISLSSEKAFDLRFFPVYGGDIYQSTCFLSLFRIRLESGQSWSTSVKLSVSPAKI